MAYSPINTADIEAGKPTKKEIFDAIRSNQEHFDDQITLLGGTAKLDMFDIRFSGNINQYSAVEIGSFVPVFKAPTAGSMVSVVMTLLTVSTSGTLTLNIDKSTDNGVNWTPVLNTPVTLTGTTVGSVSGSVDFITNGEEFDQNDLLRARFTTAQVDQGEFHLSIYGELS